MIFVPEHKKNSKIGEDIRLEKGNHIIILREGNSLLLERLRRFFFSRSLIAGVLIVSTVLYTSKAPFLKAETTIFYPKACLGGFEGVNLAEGEPETKVDSESDAFDIENSAHLWKEQSSEMYCGNFDGEVLSNTKPSKLVLTLFLATKESREVIIQNDGGASSTTFLEVLDATKIPILENSVGTDGSDSTTSSTTSSGDSSEVGGGGEPSGEAPQVNEVKVESPLPPKEIEETPATPKVSEEAAPAPPSEQALNDAREGVAMSQKIARVASFFLSKVSAQESGGGEGSQTIETAPAILNTVPPPLVEIAPPLKVEEPEAKTEDKKTEDKKAEEDTLGDSGAASSTTTKEEIKESDPAKETLFEGIKSALSKEQISRNTSSSTEHPLYEISYTLGGDEWVPLAFLGEENTKTVSLTVPLSETSSWKEVSQIQVKIKSLESLDARTDLYVDGMSLTISYEKDASAVREYTIKDIENTGDALTVEIAGEKGEPSSLFIKVKEKSGIALYSINPKGLMMATEVNVDGTNFDPGAILPKYGSYVFVATEDSNWCSDKTLDGCIATSTVKGISFLNFFSNREEEENETIKRMKNDIKGKVYIKEKEGGEVREEGMATSTNELATSTVGVPKKVEPLGGESLKKNEGGDIPEIVPAKTEEASP